MIELRWIKRTYMVNQITGRDIQVLQYREQTNVIEVELQEPIWSEWEDVPIVEDGK